MTSAMHRSPRTIRTLAALGERLSQPIHQPEIALLVGAGVDASLAGRPSWTSLLGQVMRHLTAARNRSAKRTHRGRSLGDATISELASTFPTETAEGLRELQGDAPFADAVKYALGDARGAPAKNRFGKHLRSFVDAADVRLIVSLNFTNDVADALLAFGATSGRVVRVIPLQDLAAMDLERALRPPADRIHVIALHGLIAPQRGGPTIVLSHSDFDSVLRTVPEYAQVLTALFERFTVVGLGVSWSDPAMRMAAANAYRGRRRRTLTHLTFMPRTNNAGSVGTSSRVSWPFLADALRERGLAASFGVRVIAYPSVRRHADLSNLLQEVQTRRVLGPPQLTGTQITTAHLVAVADFLDAHGDFESVVASKWYAALPLDAKTALLGATVSAARRRGAGSKLLAMRLERHLRHLVYFYGPKSNQLGTPRETRLWLWLEIAKSIEPAWLQSSWASEATAFRRDGEMKHNLRVLLDFAIGLWELKIGRQFPKEATHVRKHIAQLPGSADLATTSLAARLKLASSVWATSTTQRKRDLHARALATGWESIEAKLALDLLKDTLPKVSDPSAPKGLRVVDRDKVTVTQRETVRSAVRLAHGSARFAGMSRRQLAALIYGNLLEPSADAELSLLSWIQGAGDGRLASMDLTSKCMVVVGLLAARVDSCPTLTAADAKAILTNDWQLSEIVSDVKANPESANLIDFWRNYHPRGASMALTVIAL